MFKNLSPEALGISGRESGIIELALSYGFKGLDPDLVDFAEQVKSHGMAKAARLITSARLKIGSFRLPVRWQSDTPEYRADLDQIRPLAEIAQQLGCTRATTTIEPGSDERPYHENYEYHRRRFVEIGEALAPYKIRLGVGFLAPLACRADMNYQFMQKVDEVLMLFGSIGSSHVALSIDTWHWHLGGGTLEQLRTLSADKIATVTLADAPVDATAATAELTSRRLPGDGGAVDNAAVLALLAELRYDGPVTPAPDKSQLAGMGRDTIVKNAGAALDQVWKAAGLNAAGKFSTVLGR